MKQMMKFSIRQSRWRVASIVLLAICCFVNNQLAAQSVESRISSMEILVGEQVAVVVTAHAQDTAKVEFPRSLLVPDGIEILQAIEEAPIDEGNGMVARRCNYILTSFTDTVYPLPPIPVLISGKEYPTRQLALQVFTVDVDTTNNYENYFGPKDVQELPMSWKGDEWSVPFILSFVVVVLLIVGIILFVRLLSKKPIIAHIRIIKRIPPHQKAMKAIDEIKADKMVTAEDPKAYYTKLTDTLRQYINERYGFNAMEMTSSEIIDRLMKTDDPKSLEELRMLFTTADLVKFAKYSTLINENDANLVNAVDFINQTKQENVPTEEIIKPELTIEQQQSEKLRKVLIVVNVILAIAIVCLLSYIGWFMYDLLLY